ncbi:tyrosine-type recombinase/integrase [Curtobacterium aurantiacum]|uniref:tyrosine-type recombinase/integrase n=1 Tax=Curtobacterium aurantiacum TaxID=3236919 RepID=UPI001BE12B99|nr:tyrosine-type recombinase/integrase [Curtobacterium flaccumfaciens]MBT1675996.1 tyrosine-type recombinase/integrase [Curtobacterium flaccumfaciens pv. flaccumfaciens]
MHTFAAYATYLGRRYSPATVSTRTYWLRRLSAVVDPLTATEDDLWDFLDADASWTPNTRATVVASFRTFYRWAARQGLVSVNPTEDMSRPPVPRTAARIASTDVLVRALDEATPSERVMLLLGAECGLRASEIAGLHVDDRRGEWLAVRGKGGKLRHLHTSPELAAALDVLERDQVRAGYYFPGPRAPHVEPATIWRHVRNLTGLNTHALRHRAGTTVYRGTGNNLRVAQEFLGHAKPTTTAIYLHVELDDLERASAATRLAA